MEVFYVGRTKHPLIKRLKTHFGKDNKNLGLYNYLIENKENFIVSVIQYTKIETREKYWVKKRARQHKLYNKQYLFPHPLKGKTGKPRII